MEEHEQRLEHHLERVHVVGIFGQRGDEPPQSPRRNRGGEFFGKAAQAKNCRSAVFEERCAGEAAAQRADCVGGRLLGRRLGLEHSEHCGGAGLLPIAWRGGGFGFTVCMDGCGWMDEWMRRWVNVASREVWPGNAPPTLTT